MDPLSRKTHPWTTFCILLYEPHKLRIHSSYQRRKISVKQKGLGWEEEVWQSIEKRSQSEKPLCWLKWLILAAITNKYLNLSVLTHNSPSWVFLVANEWLSHRHMSDSETQASLVLQLYRPPEPQGPVHPASSGGKATDKVQNPSPEVLHIISGHISLIRTDYRDMSWWKWGWKT